MTPPRPAEGLDSRAISPLAALRVSLIATASNPLTIATWAAIFAATAAAGVARSMLGIAAFLGGVAAGSMSWFAILSVGMTILGRRLGAPALRVADLVAGGGLVGFALLLPVAPAVVTGWSVVDSGGLDRQVGRFEQVFSVADFVQLGRFPLILALVTLLARSPREQ